MLFINLCALIDGELQNEPSITSFSNIVFDAKKISIGDLFIGQKSDIKVALENGAYGIVSTTFKVSDNEVAWIKVNNIEVAKLKLLRYLVLKSSKNQIYLNNIELELFKKLNENRDILYISDDIETAIRKLLKSDEFECIIFENINIFKNLDLEELDLNILNPIKVIRHTLFLTSFIYKDTQYKDIKIPKIFIKEFEKVLNIFDLLNIKYSISKLTFTSHFKPIFLNNFFKIQPFGTTTKVIIIESDKNLLEKEINYLKTTASWAKIALLLPKELENKTRLNIDVELIIFTSYDDLKKKNIFYYNFAIMVDENDGFKNYLLKEDLEIKSTLF